MEDSLIQLIYASSATREFTTEDLTDLLETSRRNNTAAGITGMLLHKDGNFMQVIEGPKPAVEALHDRIAVDPRHTGIQVLLQSVIRQRDFSDWSMGFKDLTGLDPATTPGYSGFLSGPLTSERFTETPSRAHKLLTTFKHVTGRG